MGLFEKKEKVEGVNYFGKPNLPPGQYKTEKFPVLTYGPVQNVKKEDWLTLEDFQKFTMKTGEEVTVKIDCGFKLGNKVYLLDWKTGKVSDSVVDQLIVYTMYALKMGWAKRAEDVVIVPVYLAMYTEIGTDAMPSLKITMDMIKRQVGIIRDEYPLLAKAFENKDNPEFFKHTDDEYKCKRCQFRGICTGAKTEIDTDATPF